MSEIRRLGLNKRAEKYIKRMVRDVTSTLADGLEDEQSNLADFPPYTIPVLIGANILFALMQAGLKEGTPKEEWLAAVDDILKDTSHNVKREIEGLFDEKQDET